MTDLKILFWDSEYTPSTAYTWGNKPHFISNDFLIDSARMLCWGARWYGTKRTIIQDEREGRLEMLTGIRDLLSEADIVVSYNGIGYDTKKLNGELMKEGLTPPAPYKEVDLFRVVKRNASLFSHRLDYVASEFIGDKKKDTGGFQLWRDVMAGDEKAWNKMRRYQKQDVDLLVELFEHLKPWIKMPHPMSDKEGVVCRNCGGEDLQQRGTAKTLNGEYQRYQCKDCGTWNRGNKRTPVGDLRAV